MEVRYVIYRKRAQLFLLTAQGVNWVKEVEMASKYKKLKTVKSELKAREYIYDDMIICTYDGTTVTTYHGEEKIIMSSEVNDVNTQETAEVAVKDVIVEKTDNSMVPTFSTEEANQRVGDIRKHLTNISEIFRDFQEFKGILQACKDEEKKCDQETQDILHKIELSEIDNILDGWKYMKMLQEVRRRRRIAKDNRLLLEKLGQDGLVKSVVDIINCNENMQTRSYTPRVLTELFEEGN